MIIANYHQIRHKLKTGDIIGVATGNRATRLFQWLTCPDKYHADITHIGVLVWRGTRLHVAEMDGRYNVERPMSQYVGAYDRIVIFRTGVDECMAGRAIDDARHRGFMAHEPLGVLAAPTDLDINILEFGRRPLIEDRIVVKYTVTPVSEPLHSSIGGPLRLVRTCEGEGELEAITPDQVAIRRRQKAVPEPQREL